MRQKRIHYSKSSFLFYSISYTIVTFAAIACLFPFILLISASFSADISIFIHGYSLLPRDFTTKAYELLYRYPEAIIKAYGVSLYITVIGTFTGLFLITMTAYVISRKYFKYRNRISFFFFFTTLVNGGVLSSYIFFTRYLQLKDSLLALILPLLFNVFYLLIMRSFVSAVPGETLESAKMDGAGEFRIFAQIVVPLIPSGLAAIGLFIALQYWNDWYNAMLFINETDKFPLQYMLHVNLNRSSALAQIAAMGGISIEEPVSYTLKMATVVISTVPIVLVYPFIQRYFIKGIFVGSVKG